MSVDDVTVISARGYKSKRVLCTRELLESTRAKMGTDRIKYNGEDSFFVNVSSEGRTDCHIGVNPYDRQITVQGRETLDRARDLAMFYKEMTGDEFTIVTAFDPN